MIKRVALVFVATLLATASAHAVTQTAGFLEIDDPNDKATIDMNFFSISNVEDVEFQFDIRVLGNPLSTETLAANLWSVDASGDIDMQIASAETAPGVFSFHMDRFGADQLAVGDYVFIVSTRQLGLNEFPPFQMDPLTPSGLMPSTVEYEISTTTGENALRYTCQIAGNLNGTTTKSVFVGGTNCTVPRAVSEPGLMATLGGLALVGMLAARRRAS